MMAELGAIASVVQLVDVTLRVSREVRDFLDAYKDTTKDVRALQNALRDVESNVRSLRSYILEFQKSKNATEEYEVLSSTIMNALNGFDEDVLAAKKLLPSKSPEKLQEKLRWVLDKRKAQEVTKRLSERNVRLVTSLSITGRLHELRIRQDTIKLLKQQAAADTAVTAQLTTIDQGVKRHSQAFATMLSHDRQIIDDISDLRTSSSQDRAVVTSGMHQQTKLVNRKITRLNNRGSLLSHQLKQTKEVLEDIRTESNRSSERAQQATQNIHTDVKEILTRTTYSTSTVDMTARIIREELRTTLKPLLEQALASSDSRFDTKLHRMEDMVQQITNEIGRTAFTSQTPHSADICNVEGVLLDNSNLSPNKVHDATSQRSTKSLNTDSFRQASSSEGYLTSTTRRRLWNLEWKIGNIDIEVVHTYCRVGGSPISESSVMICVHFRPNQSIMHLPGVSVLYNSAPTQQGYYQLAPSIAIIPVISEDHPVFDAIISRDLSTLQEIIFKGEVRITCQDLNGSTLLHFAIVLGCPDICTFLVTQGLPWNHRTSIELGPENEILKPIPSSWLAIVCFFSNDFSFISSEEIINNMRLAKDYGCDLDETWWAMYQRFEAEPDLDPLWTSLDIWKFMVQNSEDGWHHCCASFVEGWSTPTDAALRIIISALGEGLSPNLEFFSSVFGKNGDRHPLLHWALVGIWREKRAKQDIDKGATSMLKEHRAESDFDSESLDDEVDKRDIEKGPDIWCIAGTLMQGGADIYYTFPKNFDRASSWMHIYTYCTTVKKWNIFQEWKAALRYNGLDPDQVLWEDERLRKQAFRLRGASRSGVDERDLDLPLAHELRCRRCRRAYCDKHYRGIFE